VLVGDQLPGFGFRQHGQEEELGDLVLEEAVAVLGEGGGVKGDVLQVHPQKPLEEQVVLQLLAELALGANRIERHQHARLQELLGRDRGPADLGVHRLESRFQPLQRRLHEATDAPDRVLGRDQVAGVSDREHGRLASRAAAHAVTPAGTWAGRVAGSLEPRAHARTRETRFFSTLLGRF